MAKRFFGVRHLFAVCFTVADVKELLCRQLADGKDLADGKVADSSSGRFRSIGKRGGLFSLFLKVLVFPI